MGVGTRAFALGLLFACASAAPYERATSLPTVDLDYEIHQALLYNETYDFYKFQNVPYAAPPIGELRWEKPQTPPTNRTAPNQGNFAVLCPQADPGWGNISATYLAEYLTLVAEGESPEGIVVSSTPPPFEYEDIPIVSEDCLFLDVVVPAGIFNGDGSELAPVLVEIFGGGYVEGDKETETTGPPNGIIHRSNNSIVYVTMNYRLGAFGWLAGPEFVAAGGTPNLGLYDQRFALEWVQKYIHLFGGDCNQVTVIGESAGGGSIMHQITAYGGSQGPVPFQRAIPQSPGFEPVYADNTTDSTFQAFLAYANVSTLAEAKALDTSVLLRANQEQIYATPQIGSFTYGPVVDDDFVPALPGILLAQGKFDTSVSIMAGHNTHEGYAFTSPFLKTSDDIEGLLAVVFPAIAEDDLNYITDVLYPEDAYPDPFQRAVQITTDFAFVCNAFYMVSAVSDKAYGYEFAIPPAVHGQDVPFTFYDNTPLVAPPNGVSNADAAYALQDWIITFTRDGVPSSSVPGAPELPRWGLGREIAYIETNETLFTPVVKEDDTNNDRCVWWQQALYLP